MYGRSWDSLPKLEASPLAVIGRSCVNFFVTSRPALDRVRLMTIEIGRLTGRDFSRKRRVDPVSIQAVFAVKASMTRVE